jgi:fumarylacetoacetase
VTLSADGEGLNSLAFGVFGRPGEAPRVGARIGERVLDLAATLDDPAFAEPSLNAFLASGRAAWRQVRQRIEDLAASSTGAAVIGRYSHPLDEVRLYLPFTVADYVDFYSSIEHATNLGRIMRPGTEPLAPNWRHLPVGYHGRAGTVVVSGTPVRRPRGLRRSADPAVPEFGPSRRLDFEAEVGFVVGVPSPMGEAVGGAEFPDHVFGVVLVNDWSARDIQAYETVPLGPFLGKSFATTVSAWVVPLDLLEPARVDGPRQEPPPADYLRRADRWGLDLRLEVRLNGAVISRPPFAAMYWTAAQQLAHLTVNGASLRTGDLYASGTVSGPAADQAGSLIELSWNGERPLRLPDGQVRSFLEDGDVLTVAATAPGPGGAEVRLGEVTGQVLPAVGGQR